MNLSLSGWSVIFLMALAANFPFFTESLFGLIRLKASPKSLAWRLLELLVLYALVIVIAHWLESRLGNAFRQEWQFYAVTVCLFLVFAFPGFVLRYLRRGQH